MSKEKEYTAVRKILEKEKNIILLSHINPDGDSIGSLAAMARFLIKLEKEVIIALTDKTPERYAFLLEGLPTVDSLTDLKGKTVIVLDSSDLSRIKTFPEVRHASVLVNIDHHVSNKKYGSINLIDDSAAATGEIIYTLINMFPGMMDTEIAAALYVAISTDTGSYKYDNTTSKSFAISAELIKYGFKIGTLSAKIFDERSLAATMLIKEGLETIEFFAGGKICCMTISREIFERTMARDEDMDGLINYTINIRGVEVGVLFFQQPDGREIRVGFRSRKIDVSQLALKLGGGGHVNAAGCSVAGTFYEVKAKVLNLVQEQLKV
ncbi:MAG TPA: bifunctional oligoribonuclease/PAP phosphatase NrnA [Firmicutes bacterium]|nr:bifunctional oligoribonuclease/PAP phosphatase NrnA [Bacillota bacterium]